MSWRAEYLDTVEAEQLKRLGPRRPRMAALEPEPEPGVARTAPVEVGEALVVAPPPAPVPWEKLGRLHILRVRCVYCGHGPTTGTPMTCAGHSDLPCLDPHYENTANSEEIVG